MQLQAVRQTVTLTQKGKTKTVILDPSKVISPEKSSRGRYATFVERLIIPLDQIHIPKPEEELFDVSNVRDGSSYDITHVEGLSNSFMNFGILNEYQPPVVEKVIGLPNDKLYRIKGGGKHRTTSLRALGATHWIFDVYRFDNDNPFSVKDFGLADNAHPATKGASRRELENNISYMIEQGRWGDPKDKSLGKKLEDIVRDYISEVAPQFHGNTVNAMVKNIMTKYPHFQDHVTYSSDDAHTWVDENTDFVTQGEWDKGRKSFGYLISEGNFDTRFLKILKKITETGTCNKVYLGYHSNLPKDGKSTNSKRDEFHEYLENVEDSLESVFEFKQKYGEFPWKIKYFLPQDRKNGEDMKKPILTEERKKRNNPIAVALGVKKAA
jgi:hypothetical protein